MRFVRRVTTTSVVAVCLLAAQASQVLHQLLVRHEICAEHGEVVEGGGHADGPASLAARAAPVQSGVRAVGDGELHAHDRCLAALGDGDAVTRDVAALARDLVSGTRLLARPTTPDGRRAIPLYRLAPKNSPPA
jgi:hypothetical protein